MWISVTSPGSLAAEISSHDSGMVLGMSSTNDWAVNVSLVSPPLTGLHEHLKHLYEQWLHLGKWKPSLLQ